MGETSLGGEKRTSLAIGGKYKSYEATITSGNSPLEYDFKTDTSGETATDGYIANDGEGELTFAVDNGDGTGFGDEITIKEGERFWFEKMIIEKVRVTYVSADASFRIALI